MREDIQFSDRQVLPAKRTSAIQEYYFSQKLTQIALMRQSGLDVINLGIGNPDMPPAPEVIEALGRAASQPSSHGYQSYRGTDAIRKAYANWYAREFGVSLDPDFEILPLIGSKEGIVHISLAFFNEGDHVLVPDPGYPTYASAARLAGAIPVPYPLGRENNWLPDLDALEIKGMDKVKMIWINYPHMPSGARASREFFKKIVDFANRHSILLCNDNPYSLILNPEPMSILSIPGSRACSIELNSMSKSHNMAGWRLGMAAANEGNIRELLKVKSNIDSGMFLPLQEAAVIALGLGKEWFSKLNQTYADRRQIVMKIASLLECTFDTAQSGLFLWARVPEVYEDATVLTERILHQAHVFITPGIVFGENGCNYIRISLCAPAERLQEAAKRIQIFTKNNQTNETSD